MKKFINTVKFVYQYAKQEKKLIIIYLIMNLLFVAINIIIPIISAKIIIQLTSNMFYQLLLTAALIFLIEMIRNFLNYFTGIYSSKIYRSTLKKMQQDLGNIILTLTNETLDLKGTGLFIQRITGDTGNISDVFYVIGNTLSRILEDLGILVAVFIINKKIALYLVITTLISYINEKIRLKYHEKNSKIFKKKNEQVTSFISEIVRGTRDIKMLNAEKSFMSSLKDKISDLNESKFTQNLANSKFWLLGGTISDLTDFFLIVLIIILLKSSELNISEALIIYNYSRNFLGMIYNLSNLLSSVKEFNIATDRIQELISGEDFKKERFGTKHLNKVNGKFEFKDVYFKYKDKGVLKGLNFVVNPNETVAFVGKSGSGKTTIFNLLCKMYDINQGEILIDGINIQELDKDSIRGNITIISQNPYIFNLSIKENLKLVKKDLTNKEMKEACRLACLDEFIESLPDKYDTIIGEGGVNLSGGQKQRLAIARALIQKTEIILFDEATSALDNETQSKIQEAINNMKNEYTILIIAHRLSTIINADRILYLEDGEIKAEGTHKQLLKTCESYKKLYETELKK